MRKHYKILLSLSISSISSILLLGSTTSAYTNDFNNIIDEILNFENSVSKTSKVNSFIRSVGTYTQLYKFGIIR